MGLAAFFAVVLAGATSTTSTTTTATLAPAAPPESAESAETAEVYWVRLHDRRIFSLRNERAAREAGQALERAANDPRTLTVRVENRDGVASLFFDQMPIVSLRNEDARSAGAASLSIYAAETAAQIDSALKEEQRRIRISTTVLSLSLLVLTALIAFLVMRKTGEVVERIQGWITSNPDKLPAVRLGGIEVVRPPAFRGAVQISLSVGRRLVQAVVVYLWLLFGLSMFETTRVHTDRLASLVLTPLSALVGRIVAALPLFVVAAISAVAVVVMVRFAGLFFGSVARGETSLRWLPPELAEATGVVVRFAVIIGAILFIAPIITGADETQSRAATAIFVALGLAAVPLLASAAAGLLVVYGRRLKRGEYVDIGGLVGRVRAATLLEVKIEDINGREIRIPHLYTLLRPQRMLGAALPFTVSISINPSVPSAKVREVLVEASRGIAKHVKVELVSLSLDGAGYVVTAVAESADARATLSASIADRLAAEGIKLGRGGAA